MRSNSLQKGSTRSGSQVGISLLQLKEHLSHLAFQDLEQEIHSQTVAMMGAAVADIAHMHFQQTSSSVLLVVVVDRTMNPVH